MLRRHAHRGSSRRIAAAQLWPWMAPRQKVKQMKSRANLSRCGKYRYALWREWEPRMPSVLFIGLNPSTADHLYDDQTIRRCIGFAREWDCGSIAVGNLFAFRTPHPRLLRRAADPIGPANDRWLERLVREADLVIAAWGTHGSYRSRATEVMDRIDGLQCLGVTSSGMPRHPLFVPRGSRPRVLAT